MHEASTLDAKQMYRKYLMLDMVVSAFHFIYIKGFFSLLFSPSSNFYDFTRSLCIHITRLKSDSETHIYTRHIARCPLDKRWKKKKKRKLKKHQRTHWVDSAVQLVSLCPLQLGLFHSLSLLTSRFIHSLKDLLLSTPKGRPEPQAHRRVYVLYNLSSLHFQPCVERWTVNLVCICVSMCVCVLAKSKLKLDLSHAQIRHSQLSYTDI